MAAEWHAWSTDGRFIYFLSIEGCPSIFRIPAQGGKPEMMVDLKGFLSTGTYEYYFTLDPSMRRSCFASMEATIFIPST
jgi:hypothetical protein